METFAGFPFWEVKFDDMGHMITRDHPLACMKEMRQQKITDLFVVSHGWNNDYKTARESTAASSK
jgi:hypothetical protein